MGRGRLIALRGIGWVFGLFTLASAYGALWGILNVRVPSTIAAAAATLVFGAVTAQCLSPRLVVDVDGVRYRTGPRRAGLVPWSEIVGAHVSSRVYDWAGGATVFSAHLVRPDGGLVLVARGSLIQTWTAAEMQEFEKRVADCVAGV